MERFVSNSVPLGTCCSCSSNLYLPIDDKNDASICVCQVETTADLRCRGRRKNLTRDGGGEHTTADEAGMARLVTCTTTCDDGHLVGRVRAVVDDLMGSVTTF